MGEFEVGGWGWRVRRGVGEVLGWGWGLLRGVRVAGWWGGCRGEVIMEALRNIFFLLLNNLEAFIVLAHSIIRSAVLAEARRELLVLLQLVLVN